MSENVTFELIDREESWAIMDEAAHAELGISAQQFVDRWDRGEFANSDSLAVMRVAMLRPSGR